MDGATLSFRPRREGVCSNAASCTQVTRLPRVYGSIPEVKIQILSDWTERRVAVACLHVGLLRGLRPTIRSPFDVSKAVVKTIDVHAGRIRQARFVQCGF